MKNRNATEWNANEWNESELIVLCQRDISYFSIIYNRQYTAIFRFILRKTDDEALTADLVSEVFLKAMLALPRFRFNGVPYQAYLMKIARNEVLTHYHKTKKRPVIALDELSLKEVIQREADLDLDTSEVVKLIGALEDDEIAILELKFFEGKAFQEIAYILERGESTVKMRYYRALQKLKEKVKTA